MTTSPHFTRLPPDAQAQVLELYARKRRAAWQDADPSLSPSQKSKDADPLLDLLGELEPEPVGGVRSLREW